MRNRTAIHTVLAALLLAGAVHAQVPVGSAFTYQGRLTDGADPANGTYDLSFHLWRHPTSTDVLDHVAGPICVDDVNVVDGLFSVDLDFGAASFNAEARWLSIGVRPDSTPGNCGTGTGYTGLSPRQRLAPAPFSIATRGVYVDDAGRVGIATPVPQRNLDVIGGANTSFRVGADNSTNLEVKHFSGALMDVPGSAFGMHLIGPPHGQVVMDLRANDANDGFYFRVPTTLQNDPVVDRTALAVKGNARVGIGTVSPASRLHVSGGENVMATLESTSATGTWFNLFNTSANGRYWRMISTGASSSGGGGNLHIGHGTLPTSQTSVVMTMTNAGFVGIGTGAPTDRLCVDPGGAGGMIIGGPDINGGGRTSLQIGVSAASNGYSSLQSISSAGTAWGDLALNPSGGSVLIGITAAGNARLRAVDTATTGIRYGIQGSSASSSGYGVRGEATHATGFTYGVYGQSTSPNGFGVYGNGRIGASGTKSMMIDHPLAPAEKFLLHYCTESPEPQNAYNGVVTLDGEGRAWVELPDYFAEINTDFRYQLTAIGAPAPGLYVASEIIDNRFEIAGGGAGQRVSWEVKARRNDAFVRAYGAPVEMQKDEAHRGRYLRPELFEQPNSEEIGRGSDTSNAVEVK